MLFWAVAVQWMLNEARMFVAFGLNVWDHSFLPSSVYSIRLMKLPFCFSLALEENIWGLYHTFAWNCDLSLQRELVNACTVLHTREVWGEVGLVRCESYRSLRGVGRIPAGSGAQSLQATTRAVRVLPGEQNLLNRWIFKGVHKCILDKSGL